MAPIGVMLAFWAIVLLAAPAASAQAAPPAPESCTAEVANYQTSTHYVSFDAAPGPTTNRIVLYESRDGGPAVEVATALGSRFVRNADVDSSYTYSVRTRTVEGVLSNESVDCGTLIANPPAPILPTSCTAVERSGDGTSHVITWERADDDFANGHVLYRSEDGGPFIETKWRPTRASSEVGYSPTARLSPYVGVTYTYAIKSTQDQVTYSDDFRICDGPLVAVDDPTAPIRPAACSAAESPSRTVHQTVYTPAADDNASRYAFYRSENGGPFVAVTDHSEFSAPRFDFEAEEGVTYTYAVRSRRDDPGVAVYSPLRVCDGTLTRPAGIIDPGPPTMPTSCSVRLVDGDIRVTYVPAADDNAVRYLLYRTRYIPDGRQKEGFPPLPPIRVGADWAGSVPVTDPLTNFTIDAIAGESYGYEVKTRGSDGGFTTARICDGIIEVPDNPNQVLMPLSCWIYINEGVTRVGFRTDLFDNAERYLLYRSENGGPSLWTKSIAADDAVYFTVELAAGVTYRFSVKTKGTDGSFTAGRPCENEISGPPIASGPARPASCAATLDGAAAAVAFDPAADDAASRYLLYRSEDGGSWLWTASIAAADAASGFRYGLSAGTTYRFAVKTKGTDGTFTALRECSGELSGSSAGASAVAPESCSVARVGDVVNASFVAAENDNAARYLLYRTENNGPALWTASVAATTPPATLRFSALQPGVIYEFAVKTKGTDGTFTAATACSGVVVG